MTSPNNLGTARGSIQIDFPGNQIRAQTQAVAQGVARNFGQIDNAVKRTSAGLASFSAGIGRIRGEIAGLGVVAGVLGGLGVRTAAGFEEAEIRLEGMLGNLGAARSLMDDLRKRAAAAGVPFADMLGVATRLLPTMQGNTRELERWFDLTRRVAVLNQQEGVQGAAFAINEALSSGGTDLVSLVERFNISRVALRRELTANGNDFGAALDTVLTRMGITTETADRMGKTFNASFRAAKDAALQLLAEGFAPYLDNLTDVLTRTREWLNQLREAKSSIPGVAAAVLAIATVGAPTLLFLGRMIELLKEIKTLRAGLLFGGAAALGAGAGIGITRGVGQMTGNERQQNYGLGTVWEDIRRIMVIVAKVMVESSKFVVNAFVSIAANLLDAGGRVVNALANIVPGLAGVGSALIQAAADLRTQGGRTTSGFDQTLEEYAGFLGLSPAQSSRIGGSGGRGRGSVRMSTTNPESAEIIAEKIDFINQIERIERDAAGARISATASYERQRTETIAQYELTITRDAEDFARQRARAVAQFNDQIADIQADAARREADWWGDLQERIADIQTDTQERISRIESDYRRQRERAERDHRDRLLGAAARLDASAVAEEQRRYSRERSDQEQEHGERLNQEQENAAQRIQQEQEAHAERLQEARDADARRIEEMRTSFAEQQAIEDEDRALRLQRMAEDQARQLESMDAAHGEQMAMLAQQEADERKAAQDAHIARLAEMGKYNEAWKAIQEAQQRSALEAWDRFWEDFNRRFRAFGPMTQAEAQANQWRGGNLLNPQPLPAGVMASGATGGSSVSFNGDVTVNLTGSANMNEAQMYRVARQAFTEALMEMAN